MNKNSEFQERIRSSRPSCYHGRRSMSQLSQMYFSTVLLCCVVREKDRPPRPTAAVFWDWQPPVLDCWQTSESSELLSKEGRSWSDGNGSDSDSGSGSGVRILFLHCCPNQLANYPGWETSEAVKFSKSNILPRQTPGTLD